MYPSIDQRSKHASISQSITYKKQLPPSEDTTNAILGMKQNFTISSFKPHLNYQECRLNMIAAKKVNIPLKIVFMRNYPEERPFIYTDGYFSHPLISPNSCEIIYESIFNWRKDSSLTDLLLKIQSQFSSVIPNEQTCIDYAIQQLQNYRVSVQSLRSKPPGTSPPPPPQIDIEHALRAFQHQENLMAQCEEKNALYQVSAMEYAENLSRVQCIGDQFSRGKILNEMQKKLQGELHYKKGNTEDYLRNYYEARVKYYRLKILKDKYLES